MRKRCGGEIDFAVVEVYNGSSWTTVSPDGANGYDSANDRWCNDIGSPPFDTGDWLDYEVDVSTYVRGNDDFRIRFYLESNNSTRGYGVYIDNIRLAVE